jgi:soluble epoxide hydrolase / lipid-phosphate phosphatase
MGQRFELSRGVKQMESLRYVDLPSGLRMFCRCWGDGAKAKELVVLCHGFPDCSLGWRGCASWLTQSRMGQSSLIVACDMRGYGFTSFKGKDVADQDFAMQHLCGDVASLIHALGFHDALLVGHDWGGTVVWNLALLSGVPTSSFYGLVRGVIGFCTPAFLPPLLNPWRRMQQNPGRFAYQMWFQGEEAVRALEANYEATVKTMLRSHREGSGLSYFKQVGTGDKSLDSVQVSEMLSPALFQEYVVAFQNSGLLNPLRWYRNVERNWLWLCSEVRTTKTIQVPALMVTAGKDDILLPSQSAHMEGFIARLSRQHIEDSGHFVLLEHPKSCAKFISDFYDSEFPASKL